MIKRIFLDMDGVLCNFVGAVAKLFDTTEEELYRKWEPGVYPIEEPLGITIEEMWRKVTCEGAFFWANLKPFSWTKELWGYCNSIASTVILTSPSQDPHSLAGKSMWMNQHLVSRDAVFRKFLVGPAKEFCAAPGHLLIDDSASNCKKFLDGGGDAVLFPQIWNENHKYVNDRMEYIQRCLEDHATKP